MLDLLKTKTASAMSLANGASARSASVAVAERAEAVPLAVPLRQILDNPYQPRGAYDAEHILNLAASIKELKGDVPATLGLQQVPLARLVFRQRDGDVTIAERAWYEQGKAQRAIATHDKAMVQLMFGHSRLRAFMVLSEGLRSLMRSNGTAMGMNFGTVTEIETRYPTLMEADLDYTFMPVGLGFALDHAMWKHAITENSQRKNINAIEEARSIQRAMEEFGLSTEEAGKPFGYERSTTANKVRLLKLPTEVQTKIVNGELTERHGRELLRLAADPERLKLAATEAIERGKTVRQLAENLNWEEKKMQEAQEKARQLNAARDLLHRGWSTPAGQPMPVDRVIDKTDWNYHRFVQEDAQDRILITQNGCGPHCPCFALTYHDYHADAHYRPDPEGLPHICLTCVDQTAYRAKCKALGTVTDDSAEARAKREAVAAKKAKIAQMNNDAHTVWQRWLKEQDKHTLWNNINFWQVAMQDQWQAAIILKKATDVQAACTSLLQNIYRETREYDRELMEHVHTVAKVEAVIAQLSGSVSRETGDDDEYAGIEEIVDTGDDDE